MVQNFKENIYIMKYTHITRIKWNLCMKKGVSIKRQANLIDNPVFVSMIQFSPISFQVDLLIDT